MLLTLNKNYIHGYIEWRWNVGYHWLYQSFTDQIPDTYEYLMPSEIAKRTNIRTTQISNALHDLKEKNLVVCRNEDARKGRIYEQTELGSMILKMIDNNG